MSPSTNYGPPFISGFAGVSQDASTNGGDVVLINGSFFSTQVRPVTRAVKDLNRECAPPLFLFILQAYLGKISYGPSGTEFIAAGCTVTVPHSQIACTTAPGTGRLLRWLVTVGGQVSALSTATTSYAGPTITAVSPGNGPTAGGGIVTLSGVNFGTAYASSKLSIKVNNDMQARPPAWGSWVAALLAGQPSPAPAVDAWVAGLYSVPPLSEQRAGAVESVSFRVPPGFGPAAEIIVVVDGIPSQNISYTYDAPVITNLAPDRELIMGGKGSCDAPVIAPDPLPPCHLICDTHPAPPSTCRHEPDDPRHAARVD